MSRKTLVTAVAVPILVTFCSLILNVQITNAQTVGFSITKNVLDVEVPSGDSYDGSIVIFNNPDSLITPVHIELSEWNLSDETEDIEFVTNNPELNPARWFSLNSKDFILDPNEDKEIDFTINVPKGTPPGSYLVMMRFQSVLPSFYFGEDNLKFAPEIDAVFFIKVPALSLEGDVSEYSASIVSLEPEGNKIPGVGNVLPRANAGVFDSAVKKILAGITNDGIYHFKVAGTIQIKNIFGRDVINEPLPERYLIPSKTRNIDIAVLPPPDTKSISFFGKVIKKITYFFKTNSYFGPYSAIITLEIPNEPPVVKSANFWVIPWQFWLILGLLIPGLAVLFRRLRGDFLKRFKLFVKILRGRIRPEE